MEFFDFYISEPYIYYGFAFLNVFLLFVICGHLWDREKWKCYLPSVLASMVLISIVPQINVLILYAPVVLLFSYFLGKRKNIRFSFFEYLFMFFFSYVVLWIISIAFLVIHVEVLGLPK